MTRIFFKTMARFTHRALGLARERRGMAAVEFALILPLMLLMYAGVVDTTRGVIASRKLNLLSRSISDLVSQQPTTQTMSISTAQLIFSASATIMQPYNTTGITMTVSAVDIAKKSSNSTCCDALVRWSYTQGGTLRACTTPLTQVSNGTAPSSTNFPSALVMANQTAGYGYTSGSKSYVIVADVSYSYVPFFYQAFSWFGAGMKKTTYMVPRAASGPINLGSTSGAPSGQSGTVCFSN